MGARTKRMDLRRLNEHGKRFVYRIATLVRTSRIHSMSNQAMNYSLRVASAAASQLVNDLGEVSLLGESDTVHVNDYRIRVDRGMVNQVRFLNTYLHGRGLGGFVAHDASTPEDWRHVLEVLLAAPELEQPEDESPIDGSAELNAVLGDAGVESLRFAPILKLQKGTLGAAFGGEGHSVRVAASRSLQIYVRALRAVDMMARRLGAGRVNLGVARIVQHLVDLAFEEPRHHLALASLHEDVPYRLSHPVNTAILSIALGQRLGLNRGALLDMGLAALTCDAGMTMLPEDLLEKPGPLDPAERSRMQRHVLDSARLALLGRRLDLSARRRLLVGFEHHLGFDLGGYPSPLAWSSQHLFSRMLAVCEAYDALVSDTPWREGRLPDEALAVLVEDAGTRLDPGLVRAFVNTVGRYPLGTTLLLTTGEIGVVYLSPADPELSARPLVRVAISADGERVLEPVLLDLRERDDSGAWVRGVARTLDPASVGVDPRRALFG